MVNALIGLTSVKIGDAINNASADLDDNTLYPSPRQSAYRLEILPVEIKAGKGYDEQIGGWADWNNDGFFDAATEEMFYTPRLAKGQTYKTSIQIPCNATTGTHKIRISSDYYKELRVEPCNNIAKGDIEEYLIEVFDDINPQVKFVADSPANQGSAVSFSNTSIARGSLKYEWDLNNDGIYDLATKDAFYTYNTTGWKKIKLKLTQTTCNTVTSSVYTDSVNVIYPRDTTISDFIGSNNIIGTDQLFYLTDLSSGKPNAWEWEITPTIIGSNYTYTYKNGTNKNSQNPVLVFNVPGIYTIALTSSNLRGKKSKETRKNYVTAIANTSLCNIKASDTIRDAGGYLYDNGGKNDIYTTSQKCFAVIKPPCAESIHLTFNNFDVSAYMSATGGDYLRVYDGTDSKGTALHDSAGYTNGFQNALPNNTPVLPPDVTANSGAMYIEWNSDSAFIGDGFEAQWTTIFRNVPNPKASFTSIDTIYELQNIYFTGNSTGESLKYFWDLNADGQPDATTPNSYYFYKTAGKYKVKLVVSNCGGSDTFTKTIIVLAPKAKPAANFSAPFTAYREGDMVAFTDLTTNQPYIWNWIVIPNVQTARYEFVNGTSANSQNPQIKFIDPGLYSIRLEVFNSIAGDGHTKPNYIEVSSQCSPQVQIANADVGISKFTLTNSEDKVLIDQESSAGKPFFTLYSYAKPVLLETGGRYKIHAERPTSFNILRGGVWIDLNDNGFFNDPGEQVLKVDSIPGLSWDGTFILPSAINPGISRMRVGVTYIHSTFLACGENIISEFEDYTVDLEIDNKAPVITLKGNKLTLVEEGSIYTDAGANAYDNIDGDITNKITATSNVNTAVIDTYFVNYEVRDTFGNIGKETRTVIVFADTSGPEIKLFGDDSIYVEVYNSFTDLGAYAFDNITPIVTIQSTNNVDTSKLGTYYIIYSCSDSIGNTSTIKRKVVVGDTTRPNITFLNGDIVKWQLFHTYKDSGAIVKDNYWPEVTFVVNALAVNTNVAGSYKVNYTSKDGSGNVTNRTRLVKVDDYIPPQLTLPYDTFILDVQHAYKDPVVKMTDNYYASSLLKLVHKGTIKPNIVGTYILKYYAQDPSGNLSAPQTLVVFVKDREAPTITLLGSTTVHLKRWQKFQETGYIVSDNYDSSFNVEISGNFKNADLPGTYAIIYRAVDKAGNRSNYVMRLIYVEESTTGLADENLRNGKVEFFPNPASEYIFVKAGLEKPAPVNIYVTDVLGHLVYSYSHENYLSGTLQIDARALTSGIYFIHYQAAEEQITRKLIISH
jgi:PKD repeat protein